MQQLLSLIDLKKFVTFSCLFRTITYLVFWCGDWFNADRYGVGTKFLGWRIFGCHVILTLKIGLHFNSLYLLSSTYLFILLYDFLMWWTFSQCRCQYPFKWQSVSFKVVNHMKFVKLVARFFPLKRVGKPVKVFYKIKHHTASFSMNRW